MANATSPEVIPIVLLSFLWRVRFGSAKCRV
jgi:hypothetical protein